MSASALALAPRRASGRRLAWTAGLLAALVLAWVAGFAVFLRTAMQPVPPPPYADGIVALTGGAERIETALRLLEEGRGRVLLVSGVSRGADLPELTRRVGLAPGPIARRVTLGRAATSTLGNARETASWARTRGIHSLIVVTAGYHMPRALAELGRAMPDVTLFPAPVLPPALRGGCSLSTLRMLAGEYTKWLAVRAGLTRLASLRESA